MVVLLRMCANQRPVYLQRLLRLRHGGVAFSRFDRAVTAKFLDVMGVLLRNASWCLSAWTPCAASRCSDPAEQCGPLRARLRASTRLYAPLRASARVYA